MSSSDSPGTVSVSDNASVPASPQSSLGIPSLSPHTSSTPSTSSRPSEPRYASLEEMISGGEGSRALGAASTGLEALRDILEATSTLPMVKYLAGVGIQLLHYVIDMQITNDSFRKLALRAKDVIEAIAQSCRGLQTSVAFQLERDLRQLTSSMDAIRSFAEAKASRGTFKKLWNKNEDAAAVKTLDAQLTHSFVLFLIQSNVVSRQQQGEMIRRLADLYVSSSLSPPPELITDCPLRVEEGVYLIQNAANGNVLEIEDFKHYGHFSQVHVFLAQRMEKSSQTQLWSIQRNGFKDFEFIIRNLATGYVLNVHCGSARDGTKVIGYPWQPADSNIKWSFWATRPVADGSGDYCTIRCCNIPTVLDGACPKRMHPCNDSHTTRIASAGPSFSQEWQLIPLSPRHSDLLPTEAPLSVVRMSNRRRMLLQNVQTGLFASRVDRQKPGSNIVFTSSPSSGSAWYFVYVNTDRRDRFAILDCAQPFTVTHFSGKFVYVGHHRPTTNDPHHLWTVNGRDGTFIFRNADSNMLLAARSGVVDTLPVDARDDTACHWRLIDAQTNEHVRIFCDSALSMVPPGLPGTGADDSQPPPRSLLMRTGPVPPRLQTALLDSFRREHATIRTMLGEGYETIVYAPRTIAGWREGDVKTVKIEDDDAEYKWSRGNLDPCF